jgi:hypothetical protein
MQNSSGRKISCRGFSSKFEFQEHGTMQKHYIEMTYEHLDDKQKQFMNSLLWCYGSKSRSIYCFKKNVGEDIPRKD